MLMNFGLSRFWRHEGVLHIEIKYIHIRQEYVQLKQLEAHKNLNKMLNS